MGKDSHVFRNGLIMIASALVLMFIGIIILFSSFIGGAIVFVIGMALGAISNFVIQNMAMGQIDYTFPLEQKERIIADLLNACRDSKYVNVGSQESMQFKKQGLLGIAADAPSISVYVENLSETEFGFSVWGDQYVSRRWMEMARCKDLVVNTLNQHVVQ